MIRSPEYRAYVDHLDKSGGFFYEHWGDAPVHTLALGLFAKPEELHRFDNLAYQHATFQYCPVKAYFDSAQDCDCFPNLQQQLDFGICRILSQVS